MDTIVMIARMFLNFFLDILRVLFGFIIAMLNLVLDFARSIVGLIG